MFRNTALVVLSAAAALAAGASARGAVIWDFGHFTNSSIPEQAVQPYPPGSSTLAVTQSTSQGSKTVTATGYILISNSFTGNQPVGPALLYQKDNQKNGASDEEGLGLLYTNDHELSLNVSGDATNGVPNSMIQADVGAILGFANGMISVGSVQNGTGDYWDLWGSNTPGTTGFNSAVELLNQRPEDWYTPVAIPSWGTYQYLFLSVHPDPAQSSTANILFGTIQVTDVTVPEPASLSFLSLAAGGLLLRRRR